LFILHTYVLICLLFIYLRHAQGDVLHGLCTMTSDQNTDLYEVPDAVPPIHAVSSHVATDKDPSK